MKKNLIFVLIDGARVDRLSESTEFNEIAKHGFLFDNVTTAFPYTVGAVNSIFTGRYGKENGVDGYYKVLDLKKTATTITEILKKNGYLTYCDLLHKNVITERGFDLHQAHDEYKDNLTEKHKNLLQNAFSEAKNSPIFCFLHFTNIHRETVSEVLKKYEWDDSEFYEDFENNSKRYDLVFKNACFYSRSIIETVKKLDKDNNTIIVFFSDHGTGLGERYGERNYGSYTYEETIRTFYLFLGKEIQKNKISSKLHSNLDIFPTILELCEIYNEKESVGRSLGKILTDESVEEFEDVYTFSETGALHGPFPSPEKSNVFCIKSNKYKLLYLEEPNIWELYDLHNDPKEKNNIIDKNFSFIEELKNKLLNWINRE